MSNSRLINVLKVRPISWPKGGLKFDFGDIQFDVRKDKRYIDDIDYAVNLAVTSKEYAKCLNKALCIKDELPSCPRIRRVANSSDVAILGLIQLTILKPEWEGKTLNATYRIDRGSYVAGNKMPRLGYSTWLEDSFSIFVLDCVSSLNANDGLLRAHMHNGVISVNMGSFDFFYGFVFACHKAGKTVKDCFGLLPNSGIQHQYPIEIFDVRNVALSDIQKLYRCMN